MIISATIKQFIKKRQTGKKVEIGEIRYNVYNFIKAEDFDIRIKAKNTFLT